MSPSESSTAFSKFAEQRGVNLPSSNPGTGISTMLQFFEEIHPTGRIVRGADWLLYQWGCYGWGVGEHFELDITRQFVERMKVEGEDEEVISQLKMTFFYPASAQT